MTSQTAPELIWHDDSHLTVSRKLIKRGQFA
jgi:hypothetical protein